MIELLESNTNTNTNTNANKVNFDLQKEIKKCGCFDKLTFRHIHH